MIHDLQRTLRWLSRNPAFAVAVTSILALGIGVTTAVFSIVDAVLLRPPPFESPERLVQIEGSGSRRGWISMFEYELLLGRSGLFEKTAAYSRDVVTVIGGNEPDQVFGVNASAGLFSLLGVTPHLGRTFEEWDDDAQVAVLSHRLWHRRFQASPGV